jgi:uncharacterized membrane protein
MSTAGTPTGLDDRLGRLEARLGAVEAELARWRAAVPPPYPAYPPPGPWAPAPRPVQPPGPQAPRRPTDWSKLPVWAGAAVTFVGVVLLLVLAASADWFGPTARVLAGAGLGVVLVGLAGWLVRRGGRSGAGPSALAGTGTTALFGSVVAATTLYELVPVPFGLVLCLVVAGAGIALADRWDSTAFALAVLVGVEIALLVVAGDLDWLSLAMAVLVQLGVAATALRRAPVLAPVAAGGTALHGLVAGAAGGVGNGPVLLLTVAAVALVLGVAVAVLGALRAGRGTGTSPVPSVIGIAAAPVPLLAALTAVGTVAAVVTAFAAAAVTAAAAHPRTGRAVRVAAVAVASLLVAAATIRWLDDVTLSGVLLAEALVLLVTAAVLRSRPVQLAGAVLAVIGGIAALGTALDPGSLGEPSRLPSVDLPPASLVVAALLAVVAVAGLVAALRTDTPPAARWVAWAWLPVAAGLYGASWLVVAAAQLVAPGENGFLSGHVLVTLGITGLGVVLLVRGLSRPGTARTGFALIVAALVKLVVFDLVTLDGLARVAAFIGAGLVLLAVGTWYARRAAPAQTDAAGPAVPAGPGTSGPGASAGEAP